MQIENENDFPKLRIQIYEWKKRFPMFVHDVKHVERLIENHISTYSKHLVIYRQTHSKKYLELAQHEIDAINQKLLLVGNIELMSLLSRR
mgnify:FL=1|jgi:hypothetical protein